MKRRHLFGAAAALLASLSLAGCNDEKKVEPSAEPKAAASEAGTLRISRSKLPVRPQSAINSEAKIKAPIASAYGTPGRLLISSAAPGVDQAMTTGVR